VLSTDQSLDAGRAATRASSTSGTGWTDADQLDDVIPDVEKCEVPLETLTADLD
jgi:hypothetical protein